MEEFKKLNTDIKKINPKLKKCLIISSYITTYLLGGLSMHLYMKLR